MRKKFFVLVLCILTFVFSACEPVKAFVPKELLDKTTEIQLIYYNNPDVKKISNSAEAVISFDIEKMEIIEVLSEEKEKEMLDYMKPISLECFLEEGDVDSPNGFAYRMVFDDGSYMVISFSPYAYTGIFDSKGVLINYYGNSLFTQTDGNLFFNTQLPTD